MSFDFFSRVRRSATRQPPPTPLAEIPSWPETCRSNKEEAAAAGSGNAESTTTLQRRSSSLLSRAATPPPPIPRLSPRTYSVNPALNSQIRLWRGDITRLQADAVVNAANSGLWAGGGICGAIFDAAGERDLTRACDRIIAREGKVPPGQTRLTRGFNLPAPFILHTVGPMDGDEYDLVDAYKSTLDMCAKPVLSGEQREGDKANIRSVALCCISTGIFGFDNEAACHVALRTTREWLEAHPDAQLDAIVFCVFLPKDQQLYEQLLPTYFPVEANVEAPPAVPAPDFAARPPPSPASPPSRHSSRTHSESHSRSPVHMDLTRSKSPSPASDAPRAAAAAVSHRAPGRSSPTNGAAPVPTSSLSHLPSPPAPVKRKSGELDGSGSSAVSSPRSVGASASSGPSLSPAVRKAQLAKADERARERARKKADGEAATDTAGGQGMGADEPVAPSQHDNKRHKSAQA